MYSMVKKLILTVLVVLGAALAIVSFSFATSAHAAPASTSEAHPANVPLPDNATRNGTTTVIVDGHRATKWRYTVADTAPDDVVDFYKDNMPDNGWTFVSSSDSGPEGGQILKYERGNRTCYITAFASQTSSGDTTLFITVTN